MPFTPIHMGPGILIKSILRGSFSLMLFGWTQIIMDIQPLIVLITGEGHLHGFTHTYIGAIVIAIFAALTGKYLSELGLKILKLYKHERPISIAWWVVFLSAFVGSFSHVLLDSIMHFDVEPFFPFTLDNHFLGLISVSMLHKVCLYSGLVGAAIYYGINWKIKRIL
ncbi:metal-dependent hydrolase [Pseudoalteromonas denitrificans]|uniref:LexA-binding, inner membrane-associated putative hydrolase n=1 Tax=Pseudoalteromonas denitrificans DSM 6059 TaxID=1123010 RepID=A0A1I1T4Z6_9GAMM|nr:metal-dependent hydrolase [Pseudoalteromonas denitrificans]SFD51303.1 LexA-binding, inner membrane-associated putative hydrolase [Pseudoalteromonas denitrificans DSM 6059]